MSRERIDYTSGRREAGHGAGEPAFAGYDPDTPTAGFYKMQLRSGAAYAGIRIWFGPPADPVTGDELDRSWRWQAEANGEPIDVERVWPKCADKGVSASEYRALCRQQDWAREHAPDSALADPRRKHDPLTSSVRFF